jgi:hypothetical protein
MKVGTIGLGLILCVVAVVMFVLATFWGEDIWTRAQLVSLALAFFAASTRVP